MPGRFNVDNAALAVALCVGLAAREWCLDPDAAAHAAARGLERFRGSVTRVFDRLEAILDERGLTTVTLNDVFVTEQHP